MDSGEGQTVAEIEDYVQEVEWRKVDVGNVGPSEADWVIFHCAVGDTYQAFFEDDGWWIQVFAGDPSEGPYESVDAIVNRLNDDEE